MVLALTRFASAPPTSVGDHSFRSLVRGPGRARDSVRSVLYSVGFRGDAIENPALELAQYLKRKLRSGIERTDRADVWMDLVTRFGSAEDRRQHVADYHAAVNEAFGGELADCEEGVPILPPPPSLRWAPAFGGDPLGADFTKAHGLSARDLAVVSRVLCTLSSTTCRDDCPPLPDVVAILTHELPEAFVFSAARQLLDSGDLLEWDPHAAPQARSGVVRPPLPTTRRVIENSVLAAFAQVAALRCRSVALHLEKLGSRIDEICRSWFHRLFVGTLPYQTAVHVFDCFLLEGAKVSTGPKR
ncbi:hypothetical protein T492DRAFT_502184 [Pavlovales sp. CCMP2436]|nr:hypothetical protein T492DRAFT_502184 [Pavlovales sp. CCMP2436]